MADALLQIDDLSAGYGEAVVLTGISLTLGEGRTLALLGRNGTGKTTLINSIVGITRRFGGTVALAGADVTTLRPDQRARAGIGWVPQERNIFRSLTVEENMTAVAQPGPWTVERVFEMFPRRKERRNNFGNQLSGGEQQMLAIGRALLSNPRLLIMDEPSEGLAPTIIEMLIETFRRLAAEGLAILCVEQNLAMATAMADRQLVMVAGQIAAETTGSELAHDPEAQRRWLGVERG